MNLSIFAMGTQVGSILQDQDCQFVGLSSGEDVAFALENDCVPPEDMAPIVDRALAQVDMLEHKTQPPQNLSGGQKQKVAIAGILAMDVPISCLTNPLPTRPCQRQEGDGNRDRHSCQNGKDHPRNRAQDRRRIGARV